jgi:hypothetical protein
MEYEKLDDDELTDLLYTEEDRLPREVVDEFIRRRESMVKPLSDIVSEQDNWTRDIPEWWATVHAAFILGAIGGKEVVIPLLRGARWAVAYGCDWVTERLPSIFGKVGVVAIDDLKKVAKDMTSDWYTRAIAVEGLAAITICYPDTERDILQFIHAILVDNGEDRVVRQTAGGVLIDFLKSEYKDDLLAFGREEKALREDDLNYLHYFDEEDVEEWFSEGKKDLWSYTSDWLSFYNEEEIQQRQERWEDEEIEKVKRENDASRIVASGNEPHVRETYIGRNDPCFCGSGKKYKKCCMGKETLH